MTVAKTRLVPLYDRLLVRKVEAPDVTEGGIIIPETAKEPLNRGVIVACGDGKMLESGQFIPLKVKVGDEILFGRYAGTDITVDGEKLATMREDEVFAIVVAVPEDADFNTDQYTPAASPLGAPV